MDHERRGIVIIGAGDFINAAIAWRFADNQPADVSDG